MKKKKLNINDHECTVDEILHYIQHLMDCREHKLRTQIKDSLKLNPKVNGRIREVRRVWGICKALRKQEASKKHDR